MTMASDYSMPPVFLIGAERSGTTVLRLMLDHHPQVAWLQEFEYSIDPVGDDGRWPELRAYHAWLETHRIFQDRRFQIDRALDYPGLVRSFLRQFQQRKGKPVLGATVHRHFRRLLYLWPDARFIHICRDPRDVARSNIPMGWAGNTYTGVEGWVEAETEWDRLRAMLTPDRYVEVTQEDLIREPVRTLSRLCAFLGVAYDARMLDYPQDTTYEAPNASLIEQWRRKASDEEIRLVESRVGGLLVARGYAPSGLAPLLVTPAMERRLRLQDRWYRIGFRMKRYGWRLWLAHFLSRRLGRSAWEKRVRLRLNDIDRKHLQ